MFLAGAMVRKKCWNGRFRRGSRRGAEVAECRVEEALDVPQPRVSELLNGKTSRMTTDLLAKYFCRLGREIEIKTEIGQRPARLV